jgi:hypothetical protein
LGIEDTHGVEEKRRNGDVFWNACAVVIQAANAAVNRRIVVAARWCWFAEQNSDAFDARYESF